MMNMWIYLESCHVMLFPSQQKYKDLSMAKAPKGSLSVRGISLLRASLLAIHRRGGCVAKVTFYSIRFTDLCGRTSYNQ